MAEIMAYSILFYSILFHSDNRKETRPACEDTSITAYMYITVCCASIIDLALLTLCYASHIPWKKSARSGTVV